MDRPTFVNRGGFGSENYAREELRTEIAAMMTGERLGVGHEPRHGTAYVSLWIKVLESDPREMRAAAVDAQRMSDWLMARERERTAERERTDGAGDAREPDGPERSPIAAPEAPDHPQAPDTPAVAERQQQAGPSR